MKLITRVVKHRNFLLLLSLLLGYILGERTKPVADVGVYILAIAMTFSMSAMSFNALKNFSFVLKTFLSSFLLNYLIFGGLMMLMAFLVFRDDAVFLGFVLLAASPPGPSVIPFSYSLHGDLAYSTVGVFLLHLASVFIAPLIILLFAENYHVSSTTIIWILIKVIVIPFIISRLLRHRRIIKSVDRYRSGVVNWGFFFVVMPILGLSKNVIQTQLSLVLISFIILIVLMLGGGLLYQSLMRKLKFSNAFIGSSNLMYSTKSSAFAAVAAFSVFPPESSIPAAIHAVLVTLYFIFLGYSSRKTE